MYSCFPRSAGYIRAFPGARAAEFESPSITEQYTSVYREHEALQTQLLPCFLYSVYTPLLFISQLSLLWECSLERRRRNTEKRSYSWRIVAGSPPAWTGLCRHLTVCGPWHSTSTESASFLPTVSMKATQMTVNCQCEYLDSPILYFLL